MTTAVVLLLHISKGSARLEISDIVDLEHLVYRQIRHYNSMVLFVVTSRYQVAIAVLPPDDWAPMQRTTSMHAYAYITVSIRIYTDTRSHTCIHTYKHKQTHTANLNTYYIIGIPGSKVLIIML